MGRTNVDKHPARDRIVADIHAGIPNAQIVRTYSGLSESGLSRFKNSHLDALSREIDDDNPAPSELLGRLADLVESTRRARIQADNSGSPQSRARAQANELQALEKLLDRTGVDELTTVRLAQSTGALVRALRDFADAHPEIVPDLLRVMADHEELLDLRDALKARARNQKND